MVDPTTVERAKRGEHEAFGTLVERHAGAIANYLHRFLPDGDDIDDLLQEVFLKAYLNLSRFDPARGASSVSRPTPVSMRSGGVNGTRTGRLRSRDHGPSSQAAPPAPRRNTITGSTSVRHSSRYPRRKDR